MDPAGLPHAPHALAPGPQTACYLPWLKVSVAHRTCSATRGHPRRGGDAPPGTGR